MSYDDRTQDQNQGEGDRIAARRFNEASTEYVAGHMAPLSRVARVRNVIGHALEWIGHRIAVTPEPRP
jgi:hypothetical protein